MARFLTLTFAAPLASFGAIAVGERRPSWDRPGKSAALGLVAGALAAPIFHGGALEAQKQEAIDAFRASLAAYRQTVLQGLGQVADTLRALGHDAELVKAEHRALNSARAALALERLRYAEGKVDVLRLLDAERSYQQARVGYARARAQRYLDSAQLLVALGGRSLCGDCDQRVDLADQGAPAVSPHPSEDTP
jgi:CRISPR-associated Cas5-like protein